MARDNNNFALERDSVEFGLSRSEMLDVLAEVMLVSDDGRSAFLGRFQHLQRLSLVHGINPGRGKAAHYQADQVVVIAIAMQFLQIGISPERTVRTMHFQHSEVDQSIKLALAYGTETRLSRSFIATDPSLLVKISGNPSGDFPLAEDRFFIVLGEADLEGKISQLTWHPAMSRVAIINVSTTIEMIAHKLEGASFIGEDFPKPGPRHEAFMNALNEWLDSDRRQEELKRHRRGNP